MYFAKKGLNRTATSKVNDRKAPAAGTSGEDWGCAKRRKTREAAQGSSESPL